MLSPLTQRGQNSYSPSVLVHTNITLVVLKCSGENSSPRHFRLTRLILSNFIGTTISISLAYLILSLYLLSQRTLHWKKKLESYLVIKVEDQPRKFAPNPEPRLLSVKRFFNTSPLNSLIQTRACSRGLTTRPARQPRSTALRAPLPLPRRPRPGLPCPSPVSRAPRMA